jgi:glycosyltransferase involved in cell wall biosynthesis
VRAVARALGVLAGLDAPTRVRLVTFAAAGVPRAKLVLLVYAFDEAPYRAARRTPRDAGPRRVRFGFLGQLAPHKGLACLVAAVRTLERLAPAADWEVVLHGAPSAGRHARYTRRTLRALDPRRMRLAAPFEADEAPGVLAGLDALVAPSEWDENAPLAVLQARAAGLPVIATDVPGIAEIVRTPAQGRLVPVGDAEALARAMHAVVTGELCAPVEPGLPVTLDAHLDRIEALYGEVRSEAREVVRG